METFNHLLIGFYAVLGRLQASPFSLVKKFVLLYSYNALRWAFGFAGRGELDSCVEVAGITSITSTSMWKVESAFCEVALGQYCLGNVDNYRDNLEGRRADQTWSNSEPKESGSSASNNDERRWNFNSRNAISTMSTAKSTVRCHRIHILGLGVSSIHLTSL